MLLQGKQMLDCCGRLPRFVRQLLGPKEGSIYLGCERLHWWSLKASSFAFMGTVDAELSGHK